MNSSVKPHSLPASVVLHLLPGILAGILYFILIPWVNARGFPSVMALSLAGILILLPFELGTLLWIRKRTGKKICGEIIPYCKAIPARQYLIWVPVIFILTGLIFTGLHYANELIRPFFNWLPAAKPEMGFSDEYTMPKLIITYSVFLLFIVLIIPAAEELYFRGYLLPRMPERLKKSGPVVHSLLFALYHTWTPWMFIARTFGLLPLIYTVKWKRNIFLGIAIHCLLNSIDFIQAVIYLAGR